jgi:hypothetical protein
MAAFQLTADAHLDQQRVFVAMKRAEQQLTRLCVEEQVFAGALMARKENDRHCLQSETVFCQLTIGKTRSRVRAVRTGSGATSAPAEIARTIVVLEVADRIGRMARASRRMGCTRVLEAKVIQPGAQGAVRSSFERRKATLGVSTPATSRRYERCARLGKPPIRWRYGGGEHEGAAV